MNSIDSVNSARIFNDLNGLDSIKQKARTDQDAALREVASQFESMFIGMMLKSMRQANDVMFEDSMFSSNESKFYRQMYDDQLSLSLTAGSGTGLADVLFDQLKAEIPGNQNQALKQDFDVLPMDQFNRPIILKEILSQKQDAINLGEQNAADEPEKSDIRLRVPEAQSALKSQIDQPVAFDSPEQFIAHMLPLAEKISRKAGLDPKTLVAQAALETGWGKHIMKDDQGTNSHNLFGIKAIRDWAGQTATHKTLEHNGDTFESVVDQFRSYDSYQDAFEDYLNFLQSHDRYQSALRQGRDGDKFAQALQDAGYATDPDYAAKISRIASGSFFTTHDTGLS